MKLNIIKNEKKRVQTNLKNLKKTKQEMLIQFHPKDGSLKKAEKEIVKMTTKKDVNKKIMN